MGTKMVRVVRVLMVGVTVAGLAALVAGCAGNQFGKSEGSSCSTADECSTDLICTPVAGKTDDYCCPTPLVLPTGAYASGQSNCQPTPKQ